jgi:hypothetical protein
MRFRPTLVLGLIGLALAALAAAGCGHKEETTPVVCLEGSNAYLRALAKVPDEVSVGGEATLGECLSENQDAGDLATVGEAMIQAATTLNAEARGVGGDHQAEELGYLVGTVERRSDETDGIHNELLRRLTVAARYSPGTSPLSAKFHRAYEKGFDAASG